MTDPVRDLPRLWRERRTHAVRAEEESQRRGDAETAAACEQGRQVYAQCAAELEAALTAQAPADADLHAVFRAAYDACDGAWGESIDAGIAAVIAAVRAQALADADASAAMMEREAEKIDLAATCTGDPDTAERLHLCAGRLRRAAVRPQSPASPAEAATREARALGLLERAKDLLVEHMDCEGAYREDCPRCKFTAEIDALIEEAGHNA